MALVDLIRNAGVKTASKVLKTLKVNITHKAWTGSDGAGNDTYADPVRRKALLDLTKRQRRTTGGVLVMTYATLTFLDPIADTEATSGQVRENPIDTRDIITLADGSTAPIVQTGGFVDSGTDKPFVQETILGSAV